MQGSNGCAQCLQFYIRQPEEHLMTWTAAPVYTSNHIILPLQFMTLSTFILHYQVGTTFFLLTMSINTFLEVHNLIL